MNDKRLSSEEVQRNLAYAGLFLLAFELIKHLVVSRVRGFYEHMTFGPGLPWKDYQSDVLARHKKVFEASLLYLKDHMEAIQPGDISAIQEVSSRPYSNRVSTHLSASCGCQELPSACRFPLLRRGRC